MRRSVPFFLVLCFLLTMSGCAIIGDDPIDDASDIRLSILSANSVEMRLTLRADCKDRAFDYELAFSGDENDGTVTVIAPESVRDLKITIKGGKTSTEFDGVSLYMGEISDLCETPACSPSVFIDAWKNGYITDSKYETLNNIKTVAVTASLDERREVRTWFEKSSHLPVYAELTVDGSTVIFCSIADVVYK